MPRERIVSVGFLSQGDLDRLGEHFVNHIPIVHDDLFADLLAQLDQVEIEPSGTGVLMTPHKPEQR